VQNLAGWDKNQIRGCFAEGRKRRATRGSNELARYPVIPEKIPYDIESKVTATV
jgi:hypothetical protein